MRSLQFPFAQTFHSRAALQHFAAAWAQQIPLGTCIAMVGPMGAGKTTFVQGFAKGRHVLQPKSVVSPTYTLSNEYETPSDWLIHMDWYRISSAAGILALGLDDYFQRKDAIVLIEWADHYPALIPPNAYWISFSLPFDNIRARHISIANHT